MPGGTNHPWQFRARTPGPGRGHSQIFPNKHRRQRPPAERTGLGRPLQQRFSPGLAHQPAGTACSCHLSLKRPDTNQPRTLLGAAPPDHSPHTVLGVARAQENQAPGQAGDTGHLHAQSGTRPAGPGGQPPPSDMVSEAPGRVRGWSGRCHHFPRQSQLLPGAPAAPQPQAGAACAHQLLPKSAPLRAPVCTQQPPMKFLKARNTALRPESHSPNPCPATSWLCDLGQVA